MIRTVTNNLYSLGLLLLASPVLGISIESRVGAGEWMKSAAIYPLKGEKISLRVAQTPGASIHWYRIVPDVGKLYHNAEWPWNPGAYHWLGYEKIGYRRCEMVSLKGRWEIDPFADPACGPTTPSSHFRRDMGSFWFQVEVQGPTGIERSPGLTESDEKGISPRVFRVSIRDGKGYLGYLSAFINVPAVFGSTPYQNANFIGSDCADVLMAAYFLWKGKLPVKDDNVGSVIKRFPAVARFRLSRGAPDKDMAWQEAVRPGDFIAVKYEGARMYQHIGALYKDANGNGRLDAEDWVLHAGPEPLHVSRLADGGFDGEVVVVRPD